MDLRAWLFVLLYYIVGYAWMQVWFAKDPRLNPKHTNNIVVIFLVYAIITTLWVPLVLEDLCHIIGQLSSKIRTSLSKEKT